MKKLLIALLALMPLLTHAQEEWNTVYKEIESRITTPEIKNKDFLAAVKESNSARKNQQIINKTIAKAARQGGGRVVIPQGTYLTGAITLQSGVNLHVSQGATLQFVFDRSLYPNVLTRWEGLDLYNYQPCIYARDASNIALTGRGTINGGGTHFADDGKSPGNWWYMKGAARHGWNKDVDEWQGTASEGPRARLLKMSDDNVPVEQRVFGMGQGLRPQLVNFMSCENVLIEGVTLLNSPFWVIHPVLCRNVTVRNATIINDGPNGDGCDPESCTDVLIENCTFSTGDDCIALKSGRNGDGRRANKPCENIIIRGCDMRDGHGGVVIGSEISGGVRNVFAENCTMDSPNLDRVLRIKSNSCRGGVYENIYMRNIEVGECGEAVMRINLDYEPNEIAQRGFYPTLRNVWMTGVHVKKAKYGILLNGYDDQVRISGIHVSNCTFDNLSAEPLVRTGKTADVHVQMQFESNINDSPTFDLSM